MDEERKQTKSREENTPLTPANTPCRRQRILTLISITTIVLVIIGISVYLLASTASQPMSKSMLVTKAPTPTLDQTKNWKTYTNVPDRYTIQYPSNAIVEVKTKMNSVLSDEKVNGITIVPSIFKEERYSDNADPNAVYQIDITVQSVPNNTTYESLLRAYFSKVQALSKTSSDVQQANVLINKIQSSSKPYHNGDINGEYALFGGEYDFEAVSMIQDNKLITFHYHDGEGGILDTSREALVTKILSTFKFDQ